MADKYCKSIQFGVNEPVYTIKDEELENQFVEHIENFNALNVQFNSLKSTVAGHVLQINDLQGKIETLETAITNIQSSLLSLQESIASIRSDMSNITTRIENIEKAIQTDTPEASVNQE